jgi:hypothetical protein
MDRDEKFMQDTRPPGVHAGWPACVHKSGLHQGNKAIEHNSSILHEISSFFLLPTIFLKFPRPKFEK